MKTFLRTFYFTFGQTHVHSVNGFTWDKDVVVRITALDSNAARQRMFEHFGDKWSMQYSDVPDMKYYPRGIKDL